MSTVRLLAGPCWQHRRGGVGPTVEAGAVSESDRASIAAHPWSDIFLSRDRPPCGSGSVAAPSRSDCRGGRARATPKTKAASNDSASRVDQRSSYDSALTARTSRDADAAYRGELLEGLDLIRTRLGIPSGLGARTVPRRIFSEQGDETRLGWQVAVWRRRQPGASSTASGMGPPNRRPGDIRLRRLRDHCPGSAPRQLSGQRAALL